MHITNDRREYYRNEYLKSDHWKFVRGLMLRMFPQCRVCGARRHLDVHHRNYRNLYDVCTDDLIVLCRAHHGFIHRPTSDNKKPDSALVEQRLVSLLPMTASKQREAYLAVARRFFQAASKIEQRFGVRLKGQARMALKIGKPTHDSLAVVFDSVVNPPIQRAMKPKKKKFHHRQYDGPFLNEWKRYLLVAKRFFEVSRKIQHRHGVVLIPRARRVFRLPSLA